MDLRHLVFTERGEHKSSQGGNMTGKKMPEEDGEPVLIPIDGILDLHAFAPQDVSSLVKEYLQACLEQGIYEVKIIHGKGKGVLRRTVHALLENHPEVLDFKTDSGPSSWGATMVWLKNER